MRIVDADRLKKSFEANTPIAFQDCVPGIQAIIDLEPTVEAEPVRHGKWIGGELGECSVCGHHGCASDIWNGCANQYCPNCGAKMDERKEECI